MNLIKKFKKMHKKKIGIIGATGYTGSELVRILKNHPHIEIAFITSESRAGEKFSDVHPFFQGIEDQKLISINDIKDHEVELVFLALPHGVSMSFVKEHSHNHFKIIDLSGDFRLKDATSYKEWYQADHVFPHGIKKAVFGSPELFKEKIKNAKLIANPGCYPTSAILGLSPLLKHHLDLKNQTIIIDSKSGVTGAGVKAKAVNMYSNVNDNFKAYGLKKHRHSIEIQQILSKVAGEDRQIQFTPHLLPVDRGILSTIYLSPAKETSEAEIQNLYADFYADAPFVRLRHQAPAIKDVRGSNFCDIFTTYDERTNMIMIISVIDNLVKGAAGQAVQNMNLMLDLDETAGLNQVPINP